ncbi:MAG: multicopper oxidase family protein [Chitinophagales bacterium]
MNRRLFLRNTLLGSTAVAVTPAVFLASCDATGKPIDLGFGTVGGLQVLVPPDEEWVNVFSDLPFKVATAASIGAYKNYLHLKGINSTFCYGYSDTMIWGPTLKLTKGQTANISFENSLQDVTNVHFHGLTIPSTSEEGVDEAVPYPGSTNYNFQVNNRAGLYWYHPQYDKVTGKQVAIGLGGLFMVEDAEEGALNLPSGTREVFIVLQDKRFNESDTMFYGPCVAEQMVGYLGETILVNGVHAPTKEVNTRIYRLRICNASTARIYNIGLTWDNAGTTDDIGMAVIGGDGGLLDATSAGVTSVLLAPGERVDVLVDFSDLPIDTVVNFKSKVFSGAGDYQGKGAFDMMRFKIIGPVQTETFTIPGPLSSIPVLTEAGLDVREINVQNGDLNADKAVADPLHMHEINSDGDAEGDTYDSSVINFTVPAGSSEVWNIKNDNGDEPVAIHIYGVQCQILERTGGRGVIKPWEKGWKDTILALPGETVKVIVPFLNEPGKYYLTATNLEMADSGMINSFEIV